ncbi:MAG: VanW family protein [Chloroflexota bacterium]
MHKRKLWPAALVLLGVPALVVLGLVFGMSGGVASPRHIAGDVVVGPLRLQGASRAEAAERLVGLTPEQAGWQLQFTCGDRVWSPTAADIGVSVDIDGTLSDVWRAGQVNPLGQLLDRLVHRRRTVSVPVRLRLDEATLRECLARYAAEVNVAPRNASFDLRSGQILAEAAGRRADIDGAVAAVRDAVTAAVSRTIELALLTVEPATRAADLAVLGSSELSRFETYYPADAVDRSTNIELAAQRLSGTIIRPGEVFSFNGTVGPRTRELGYREALEIVGGEYVMGLGGGVCQVSSTVYNAGLLAGLNVVERYPHSRKPSYVEPGRDATVVYGNLDLKLRNDRKTPVIIAAYADAGVLCVSLRGQAEAGEKYAIVTTLVATYPATTREEPDPTLLPGQSQVREKPVDGIRVLVRRICQLTGKVEEISNDYYQPVTGIVRVAPEDLSQPVPDAAGPAVTPR